MSATAVIKAFQAIEADSRLTNVDKLVLLRYAWKTPEHGAPRSIRFKTYARELNCCPKTIKKTVFKLIGYGYLKAVSVQVVDGPSLEQFCQTPPRASGQNTVKGGPTPPSKVKSKGGSRPPTGGCHTPFTGGARPPLTKQKEKESEVAQKTKWLKAATGRPFDEWKALEYAD